MKGERDDGMSDEARELLGRLSRHGYLCWNSEKMEGPAHDLIMLGYAEGRRPPRHRNWYIDITDEGRAMAPRLTPSPVMEDGDG